MKKLLWMVPLTAILVFSTLFFLNSCGKDDPPVSVGKPTIFSMKVVDTTFNENATADLTIEYSSNAIIGVVPDGLYGGLLPATGTFINEVPLNVRTPVVLTAINSDNPPVFVVDTLWVEILRPAGVPLDTIEDPDPDTTFVPNPDSLMGTYFPGKWNGVVIFHDNVKDTAYPVYNYIVEYYKDGTSKMEILGKVIYPKWWIADSIFFNENQHDVKFVSGSLIDLQVNDPRGFYRYKLTKP